MLWLIGSKLVYYWLVLRLVLHKTGTVHMLLIATFSIYVIQIVQDRRTRAYKADQRLSGPND